MASALTLIDTHSHLLCGLDDGPRDIEASMRLCRAYVGEGVSAVVATPHVREGMFRVGADTIRRGVQELSLACRRRGLELQILPGSEVSVTPELLGALDAGELVTVADTGRYLLLELHLQRVPPLHGLVFELATRGVTPILCHPERHPQFWRDTERLEGLVEQGCLVQVTASSLLGANGQTVRRTAARLLRAGLVHVVASDAHSATRRPPRMRHVAEWLLSVGGVELARRLLETHPLKIIRGEPLAGPPVASVSSSAPVCR